MASIDSVLNPYIIERGFSWQPILRVASTDTDDAGSLPVTRLLHTTPLYGGTITAAFHTRAELDAFVTFWQTNRALEWAWTNPDDGLSYTCKFVGDTPGYTRQGPERFVVQFDAIGYRV